MSTHIIPINDLKEHEVNSTCHCEPTVKIIEGSQLIIHNSFDGREAVEMAKEILRVDSLK